MMFVIRWILVLCIDHRLLAYTSGLAIATSPAQTHDGITTAKVTIVPAGESLPVTDADRAELSVASMNTLAPSYHYMAARSKRKDTEEDENDDEDESLRQALEDQDRSNRVPMALDVAKRVNADILLLQEVEGREHEPFLARCLESSCSNGLPGYDQHVWSALYPNRQDDVVGNAVAWRSDRFRLVSQESFRRGMIVQLQDGAGSTIVVANLHLFAKPSAIEQRLRTMASTIRRLQSLELGIPGSFSPSPLNGLVILGGDLNCGHPSVTTRLATKGYAPYGRLEDRNYSARITKHTAAEMRHSYRFTHAYEDNFSVAPVTVSLHGRGPGCMDHLMYMPGRDRMQNHQRHQHQVRPPAIRIPMASKRSTRRQRALRRVQQAIVRGDSGTTSRHSLGQQSSLRVQALLATVDAQTLPIVEAGLPNVEQGFPSDHLPIGVVFGPEDPNFMVTPTETPPIVDTSPAANGSASSLQQTHPSNNLRRPTHRGLSTRAFQRRQASDRATLMQRRHNSVLRIVAEWLLQHGATDLLRDQPLTKWPWIVADMQVKNKLRAPDLCFVLQDTLFILEVAVRGNVELVQHEKRRKYKDLVPLLRKSPVVQARGLRVASVAVIALNAQGDMPFGTRNDIEMVANKIGQQDEIEAAMTSLLSSLESVSLQQTENSKV